MNPILPTSMYLLSAYHNYYTSSKYVYPQQKDSNTHILMSSNLTQKHLDATNNPATPTYENPTKCALPPQNWIKIPQTTRIPILPNNNCYRKK